MVTEILGVGCGSLQIRLHCRNCLENAGRVKTRCDTAAAREQVDDAKPHGGRIVDALGFLLAGALAQYRDDACCCLIGRLMLPHTHDLPARHAKLTICLPISLNVVGKLQLSTSPRCSAAMSRGPGMRARSTRLRRQQPVPEERPSRSFSGPVPGPSDSADTGNRGHGGPVGELVLGACPDVVGETSAPRSPHQCSVVRPPCSERTHGQVRDGAHSAGDPSATAPLRQLPSRSSAAATSWSLPSLRCEIGSAPDPWPSDTPRGIGSYPAKPRVYHLPNEATFWQQQAPNLATPLSTATVH